MQSVVDTDIIVEDNVLTEQDLAVQSMWEEYKNSNNINVRNQLVLHYMAFVKKIAFKTYRNAWFLDCADELVNEGVIAVINAIDRFDLSLNIKFETFASRRIQGAMLDYIRKQSGFVRKIHEMTTAINNAKDDFFYKHDRQPTNAELAEALSVSVVELDNMLKQIQPIKTFSIDQTDSNGSDDDKTFEISTGSEEDPIEILSKREYNEDLVRAIQQLNEQQQIVLSLFYKEEFSVGEIADILKLTPDKVSQIRFQAIKKMKKLIGDKIIN